MNQDDSKRPPGYTDAIHEVLQKAAAALPRKDVPQNTESDKLPHQFTFEQWQKHDPDTDSLNVETQKCFHDWQIYRGFHFDDLHCTKCGQKRALDPSK